MSEGGRHRTIWTRAGRSEKGEEINLLEASSVKKRERQDGRDREITTVSVNVFK